jgi:hypothetical protein
MALFDVTVPCEQVTVLDPRALPDDQLALSVYLLVVRRSTLLQAMWVLAALCGSVHLPL